MYYVKYVNKNYSAEDCILIWQNNSFSKGYRMFAKKSLGISQLEGQFNCKFVTN